MQPSASRQMPSGPIPSAQTRRFDSVPSSAMSKAVRRAANDSATIERLVVRRDDHAVREGDLARDLACLAVGRDERDLAECLAAREHLVELGEVEVDRVDVDVAASVDGQLAPAVRRDVAEIGVRGRATRRARPGSAPAPVTSIRPSGKPVRRPAEPVGPFSDHFAVAVEIDGNDLPRAPVREPQTTVVPPRRLGHGEAVEKYARPHAVQTAGVVESHRPRIAADDDRLSAEAHAVADPRVPTARRRARRAAPTRVALAPACGVGGPARTACPAPRCSRFTHGSKGRTRPAGRIHRSSSSGGRGSVRMSSTHATTRSSRSEGCRTMRLAGGWRRTSPRACTPSSTVGG